MKIIPPLICIMLLPAVVSADVYITQVLYNPLGTESGGEAVEIFNNATTQVNISDWVIATSSSKKDAILPNKVLQPKQYFLITDKGWNASKDNASWKDADFEEPITMKNTNAGVAILDNGQIIDAVGWGSVEDPTLFKGQPTKNAKNGFGLKRINFTNDNKQDFAETIPFFGTEPLEKQTTNALEVSITVLSDELSIKSINVFPDEDQTKEGVQVHPNIGFPKEVFITVQVESTTSYQVRATLEKQTILLENNQGTFLLDHSLPPGEYGVEVEVFTDDKTVKDKVSFEYLPLLALELDTNSINFGNATPEAQVNSEKVKITNMGNVILDVALVSTVFSSNANNINPEQVRISFDNDFESELSTELSTTNQIIDLDLDINAQKELGLQFTIPENTNAGTYQGTITIVGVGSS